MHIELTPIESSQIHAIGHDPATNTLAIQFKSKAGPGSIYHYANVPAEKYAAFQECESKGRFFGAEFKVKAEEYPFTKIEPKKDEGEAA